MIRICLVLLCASTALLRCSHQLAPPTAVITADFDGDQAWQSVLICCVDVEGRVDFRKASSTSGLAQYVAWIANHGPKSSPELFKTANDRLAHYLNSYNALAMFQVIKKEYPEDLDGFFKRLGFFVLTKVKIDGEYTSLFDYENALIRKLGDPRVHFALNCMSVGCPRLPATTFKGASLEKQLDQAAIEFFNSDKYVQVESDLKQVKISEILDFFTEDFVNPKQSQTLIDYVNRYRKEKIPRDYEVSFITYDWTINKQG